MDAIRDDSFHCYYVEYDRVVQVMTVEVVMAEFECYSSSECSCCSWFEPYIDSYYIQRDCSAKWGDTILRDDLVDCVPVEETTFVDGVSMDDSVSVWVPMSVVSLQSVAMVLVHWYCD